MPIPDYQTLMLPVLKLASEAEVRVPELAQKIGLQLGLSDEEMEQMLPSGTQRLFHNRIHWAKFYLSKAGLIVSSRRGIFAASQAGRDLIANSPERIDVEALRAYPAFLEFLNVSSPSSSKSAPQVSNQTESATATPEEQIDAAYTVLGAALKAELLGRILEQTPTFFERLIVDLLVAMGYGGSHENAAMRLGKSGDGGIDGIVDEDRLGLDRIYVQAKRYAPHVGVGRPEIQAFVGSLVGLGASKGVFVTTSSFSSPALEFVRGLQQRIVLIDGARLTELMVEFGVGVRINRTIEFKRLDEDFFADNE